MEAHKKQTIGITELMYNFIFIASRYLSSNSSSKILAPASIKFVITLNIISYILISECERVRV